MKLTRSLIRSASFFRRRRRTTSNASFRRTSTFFTRKRGAAAENPEPSSPKVTCIGQVRVQSQKRVKQYRRRIGEASFRSAEQPQPPRDQRWVHLPSVSLFLRAFGQEFCCLFRCRCCCFARRERGREKKKIKYSDDNGCGTMVERWLVAVNAGEGERRREIEVVVGSGEAEEEEATEMISAEHSRRHVFDDIEVNGDRVLINGEREAMKVSICIPPKNALLLMRCRSDPLKMAAIANRISSDAGKYKNGGFDEEDDDETQTTSSDELFAAEDKIYVAEVLDKEKMHVEEEVSSDRLEITKEEKVEEIEEEFNQEEEEKEERESNLLSEAQDCAEEESKPDLDISSAKIDEIQETTIIQDEKEDKLEAELPEDEETAAKKEATAAAALPECLLLMMREPKLSMEVSKETWVCATDFIRLLPERPRRPANKAAAAAGCDHEPVVRKRTAVEKSKPRVPAPPGKKSDVQPARSSCSLPAAAAVNERKRANGGAPCEPLALTRCKSEPMSTAAAKLMPEGGCWKDNVEPHRQASVGVGAAGVGF